MLFPLEWRIKGGSHPRSSLHGRAGERTHDCPAEGRLVHLCRKWLVKRNQGNRAKDLVFVLQFALTESLFPLSGLSHGICCLSPSHFPFIVAVLPRGLSPSQKPPALALLVSGRSQPAVQLRDSPVNYTLYFQPHELMEKEQNF